MDYIKNKKLKQRNETEMDYIKMTVTELRKETKQRGLPQQENGKKFTKKELIERLEENDREDWGNVKEDNDDTWEPEAVEETKTEVKKEVKKEEKKTKKQENKKPKYDLVEKMEELHAYYTECRDEFAFESGLRRGSMVVFRHLFKSKSGEDCVKMRKAKIIYLRDEDAVCEMAHGDTLRVPYTEMLFSTTPDEKFNLPPDLRLYFTKQYYDNKRHREERKHNGKGFKNKGQRSAAV